MIAWKWTLNNKDVTAVIAPKQSETASINNLAIRIMKLAKENSKRFVATRAKRDKLQKAIDETTATLNQTGIKLSDLKFVEKATLPSGGISHRFAGVVNDDTPVHLKKDELQAYEWVDADKLGEYELLGSLADLQDLIELAKEKIHIIEEWDSTTHSEILSNLLVGLANNKDLAVIYNQYFTDHLQGKSVMTQIGKVWINGETKKEVRKNLDELKILTVPYIPEILIKGEIGTPEPNRDLSNPKKPKKQKYE